MTTSKRLSQVAKTAVVLPFLLAALLGFTFHTSAVTHTPVASSHQLIAADDPPPGH